MKTKTPPDRIFLQWYGTDDVDPGVEVDTLEVTWASEAINDSDIEYRRVKKRRSHIATL